MVRQKDIELIKLTIKGIADDLEAGRLIEEPYWGHQDDKNYFTMGDWFSRRGGDTGPCYSVGCIGGWCEQRLGDEGHLDAVSLVKTRYDDLQEDEDDEETRRFLEALDNLFYPGGQYAYDRIKAEEAVRAMRNFLDHENADWHTILTEAHKLATPPSP